MSATTMFRIAVLLAMGGKVSASVYEGVLNARQADANAYIQTVCYPNVTSPTIPPCQEIINIESACLPNGTSSLDLLAHAECMCTGSYFSDWIGCLDCLYVHGARSPAATSAFNTIITSVSQELCTGTPTAPFESLFSSLNYNMPASGSQTVTTDLFPSQTAVSLYFTPSGIQGPGAITGSATLATKTGDVVETGSASGSGSGSAGKSSTGTGSGNGSKSTGTGSASAGSQSSSTSSSKAGAAPTDVWMGGLGLAAGIVGMVVL
ncbi:hypothetical protein EG329_006912 [Mollisiaceae sp. DMI_Dod_QoI]|nr:hypothetical protein EG329_006912 [Helotiales sp. DMI_Dod_QoI]